MQLHAELEQERSKSSALKQEIAKHQVIKGEMMLKSGGNDICRPNFFYLIIIVNYM